MIQKMANSDQAHVTSSAPFSEVHLEDCVKALKRFNDKHFDLAVVDPPYGIGASKGTWGSSNKGKVTNYGKKDWDNKIPNEEYFFELMRVSKNQIIWGGNYFQLPIQRGWIFWDKDIRDGLSFSDGELAWTNFDKVLRKIFIPYSGFRGSDGNKIHPTQKPVKLYNWIYQNYAEPKQRILDTHLGSGSSAISAYYFDMNFVGCEIDKEYFEATQKRFKELTAQTKLF